MYQSPQGLELRQRFLEIDADKKGYITVEQFKVYNSAQLNKIPLATINRLFITLENGKMGEKDFITFMMGYRLNLGDLAIARFGIRQEVEKHQDASPSAGVKELKESFIKMQVAAGKDHQTGQKKKFSIRLGRDKQQQEKKFEEFKKILDREPRKVVALIKFRADAEQEAIAAGLKNVVDSAIAMVQEMDQTLSMMLNLFNISVKNCQEYVYIFVEVQHHFIEDMVGFLNQMSQALSADALLKFEFSIASSMFQSLLKQQNMKKMQDLEVNFDLKIDSETMKKAKKIMLNNAHFSENKEKTAGLMMSLLEQIQLQANFANSQDVFNEFGGNSLIGMALEQTEMIKELSIAETAEGFLPGAGDLIQLIKSHARGIGQISLNLDSFFLETEFNLEIEGLLDML